MSDGSGTRFVDRLLDHPSLAPMVVHHRRIERVPAVLAQPRDPLPPAIEAALTTAGLGGLYRHQAEGIDRLRERRDVLLVTPTASGKTLLFSVAVLETALADPSSRALLLYPTKALAQDQLAGFRALAGGVGALRPPSFEIYDGDTPQARRRHIRSDPPSALITNPDMLHMGILAHHHDWAAFLRGLRWVVLDELHVYRGMFGAHVHHILARLERLCAHYGARPQFIAASATVGNPAAFARTLVGREFVVIDRSGAPASARDVVFVNPIGVSPYTVAVRVVAEAIRDRRRTIAFAKARRVTELLHSWLVQHEPEFRSRVAPYRAGYLPEERRAIEGRLFRGELSAILSTSALELGIDVGALDVCVLVGYPGSLISSWQRIGRVGRRRDGGAVVLIAMPDALDQYVVRHPDLFFGGRFENAVLDPWNRQIAGRHLVCAAAERPLAAGEYDRAGQSGRQLIDELVRDGRLVQDAAGTRFFSFKRRPQREVSVRAAGEPFVIVDTAGKLLGTIDGQRVYHECHAGAIYLHGGRSFLVRALDADRRRVTADRANVDYYTVVLGDKETAILERLDARRLGDFPVGLGRLEVTVRIRGYQKKRLFDGEPIAQHPLDVPPLVFETVGLWIELPAELPAAYAARELHFMGGIHAVEHAMIGLFPLLAIADRDDVGGISYTGHPQLGAPAVFVYDGLAGGAGLAEQGFREIEHLVGRTLELVRSCDCEDGCPACIQSPKCGNGNKPLDKAAALLTLRLLGGEEALASLGVEAAAEGAERAIPPAPRLDPAPIESLATGGTARRHGITRSGNLEPARALDVRPSPPIAQRTLIFDLETQRGADEVGGWAHVERMGLALAVVYDTAREVFRTYFETDVDRLLLDLVMADRVVGFNVDRFDMRVLAGYTDWDLSRVRTVDMLGLIHRRLGFRVSLEHLCEANLGESKVGDGLQSLRWWKDGRIDLIEQYCKRDVELTRRLWDLGQRRGYLLYRDHEQRTVRVPVEW
ncbi:MAG TPA: DEAD/DEAH box helicase [Candidatus Polarisedimenticolaceae bacterium]|nr:DEAD/DEAH box helicase [Candidatus Polarisedimenticolaceae bacterium]